MSDKTDFVNWIYQEALAAGLSDGAARVMAAQAGIESNYGERAPGFNYFAITAGDDWTGETIERADKDAAGNPILQEFRVYATPEEGIADRIAFMDSRFPEFNQAATIEDAQAALLNGVKGKYYEAPPKDYNSAVDRIISKNLPETATVTKTAAEALSDADYLTAKERSKGAGVGLYADKLDPEFARRMSALIAAAENATGDQIYLNEGYRDPHRQAQLRANYTGEAVTWEGQTYTPNDPTALGINVAAKPGQSEHQLGMAVDIIAGDDPRYIKGPAFEYMVAHAEEYGIHWLGSGDPAHFEIPPEEYKAALNGTPLQTFELRNPRGLIPPANIPETAVASELDTRAEVQGSTPISPNIPLDAGFGVRAPGADPSQMVMTPGQEYALPGSDATILSRGDYDLLSGPYVPQIVEASENDMGGIDFSPHPRPAILTIPGLVEQGNIDLYDRPKVVNADGSISTVRSISFEEDGKEILIPTVSPDGRILTDQEAVDLYHQTGKHLGKFLNATTAVSYATALHDSQEAIYAPEEPLPFPGPLTAPAEVAPTPMPGRPADVAKPKTVNINGKEVAVGSSWERGGMRYWVTEDGLQKARIPTGEPTIVSGVVGDVVEQATTAAGEAVGDAGEAIAANAGQAVETIKDTAGGLVTGLGNALGNLFGGPPPADGITLKDGGERNGRQVLLVDLANYVPEIAPIPEDIAVDVPRETYRPWKPLEVDFALPTSTGNAALDETLAADEALNKLVEIHDTKEAATVKASTAMPSQSVVKPSGGTIKTTSDKTGLAQLPADVVPDTGSGGYEKVGDGIGSWADFTKSMEIPSAKVEPAVQPATSTPATTTKVVTEVVENPDYQVWAAHYGTDSKSGHAPDTHDVGGDVKSGHVGEVQQVEDVPPAPPKTVVQKKTVTVPVATGTPKQGAAAVAPIAAEPIYVDSKGNRVYPTIINYYNADTNTWEQRMGYDEKPPGSTAAAVSWGGSFGGANPTDVQNSLNSIY